MNTKEVQMTRIAIIRCEKNEETCPLTNCFNTMMNAVQGFSAYDECIPAGVFTCRCPGDNVANLGKILKSKGADVIHLCTCSFAKKTEKGWDNSQGGFCDHIEKIAEDIARAAGLPCVLGTAHLPKGYTPVTVEK
jgi:predicted metal-binding protein